MTANTFLLNLKCADSLFLRVLQRPASRTANICEWLSLVFVASV
jgi:hypothetical protein